MALASLVTGAHYVVPTAFVFQLFTPIFLKSVQLKITQPPSSRSSFFSLPPPDLSSSNLVPNLYLGKYSIQFYMYTPTNSGVTQLHLSVMTPGIFARVQNTTAYFEHT